MRFITNSSTSLVNKNTGFWNNFSQFLNIILASIDPWQYLLNINPCGFRMAHNPIKRKKTPDPSYSAKNPSKPSKLIHNPSRSF